MWEDRTGEGSCVERTVNMWFISVTLDVSKLSGWLNAEPCRKPRRRHTMSACGVGVAQLREARAERT